jgi:hypothetical protein
VVEVDAAAAAEGDGLRWEPSAAVAVGPREETPALNDRRHGNKLLPGRMSIDRRWPTPRGPMLVRGRTSLRGQRAAEILAPQGARDRTSIGQTQILAGRA